MSKWFDETPVSGKEERTNKVEDLLAAYTTIPREVFIETMTVCPERPSIWGPFSREEAAAMFDDAASSEAGGVTKESYEYYAMVQTLLHVYETFKRNDSHHGRSIPRKEFLLLMKAGRLPRWR